MPELAEVEFYRKRWHLAARGERIRHVDVHAQARVFRGCDPAVLVRALQGSTVEDSAARAKQMVFRFRRPGLRSADVWVGLHLGMSGELTVAAGHHRAGPHDHVVLRTSGGKALVFSDPRMFGRVQFHTGTAAPDWWSGIAPAILSPDFTFASVVDFLQRRRRAPIKAVLLMQERFPGIGNWMADEILWRAAVHPARAAGTLSPAEIRRLWKETRHVARSALVTIAGRGDRLPRDLNVNIPRTWLFKHRWRKGGKCPLTGTPLAHATIGGRTTCWSPARQQE